MVYLHTLIFFPLRSSGTSVRNGHRQGFAVLGLPSDLQKPLPRTKVLPDASRNRALKPKVVTKTIIFTLLL